MVEEKKERAGVLDSLAFSLLAQPVLVRKLAAMFIKAEPALKDERRRRRGWEVNDRTVGGWLRTVYTPPHGSTKATVEALIEEVGLQKKKIIKRTEIKALLANLSKAPNIYERRNRVANNLYRVCQMGYRDVRNAVEPRCSFIVTYADWLVALDGSNDYYRSSYVFIRNKRTNVSKLIEIGRHVGHGLDSLSSFLFALAPVNVRQHMFLGASVVVDFDSLSFVVDGKVEASLRGNREWKELGVTTDLSPVTVVLPN